MSTPTPSHNSPRTFKLTVENPYHEPHKSIRRFQLNAPTFSALEHVVGADATIKALMTSQNGFFLDFTYLDEDNDAISVKSEMEMEEMMRQVPSEGVIKMTVKVIKNSLPTAGSPPIPPQNQQPSSGGARSGPQPKSPTQQPTVHDGHACDICTICPIKGTRHHCLTCGDYDLCNKCFGKNALKHDSSHKWKKIGSDGKASALPSAVKIVCDGCQSGLPRASDAGEFHQSTDGKHHLCNRCHKNRALLSLDSITFEKHGSATPASVPNPPSYSEASKPQNNKYKDQLEILKSMDLLSNRAEAEKLLEKYKGNLPKVVNELLGTQPNDKK